MFKRPFKQEGFDSLIGKGQYIQGDLVMSGGTTMVLDGEVSGDHVLVAGGAQATDQTKLIINGALRCKNDIAVSNVTITGTLACNTLTVEGLLAIKAGAKVVAKEIRYRDIVMENGSVVLAMLNHLDHISAGEQV